MFMTGFCRSRRLERTFCLWFDLISLVSERLFRMNLSSNDLHGPVIVAMITMWMMKMSIYEVVDMITMRHSLVTATGAVHMIGIMSIAFVLGSANIGIGFIDFKNMLIDVVTMRVMKMTIVQKIDMAIVDNLCMSAVFTMFVVMIFMCM